MAVRKHHSHFFIYKNRWELKLYRNQKDRKLQYFQIKGNLL